MGIKWTYGITTVPERIRTTLGPTIQSLAEAGFDQPRLFIDGAKDVMNHTEWSLPITCRWPRVSIVKNWIMSATELLLREPSANRIAIFQDDIVICKNTRQYLESFSYPNQSYLNLYCPPEYEKITEEIGWFETTQKGRGAVALVFDRDTLLALISQTSLFNRVKSVHGWKCIDGAIIDTFKKMNIKERAHRPSLVYHTGRMSTLRNSWRDLPATFPGKDFNALDLLCPEKIRNLPSCSETV